MIELGLVEVHREDDVVHAHQTTRTVAAQLGFSGFEQTRIATAMSEIARNALSYAGGGTIAFCIDEAAEPALAITVTDRGPGIDDVEAALRGERQGGLGSGGLGISGARRLMDHFAIDSVRFINEAHAAGPQQTA